MNVCTLIETITRPSAALVAGIPARRDRPASLSNHAGGAGSMRFRATNSPNILQNPPPFCHMENAGYSRTSAPPPSAAAQNRRVLQLKIDFTIRVQNPKPRNSVSHKNMPKSQARIFAHFDPQIPRSASRPYGMRTRSQFFPPSTPLPNPRHVTNCTKFPEILSLASSRNPAFLDVSTDRPDKIHQFRLTVQDPRRP